ncbi:MAG: DNA translocase FtsK [Alphaproteobacteria bacterium]|jgi:DNA segregation ATPase FtsK/SpoIIIE, S-DNA-T family|nr:DNA translocase FtsK [Alphaproteobacteria bacterium]
MTQDSERRSSSLLPAGATEFFRRRALEITGAALAITGGLLALSMGSYSPDDPSWNNATGRAAENFVGTPGAYVADIVIQTLGVAGALAPVLLAAWAWRLFSHQGLPRVWLNLTLVPPTLLFAAGFASSLAAPDGWPIAAGLGGWLGDVLSTSTAAMGLKAVPGVPPIVWGSVLGVLGLGFLTVSLGLAVREWRAMATGVGRGVRAVARLGGRGLRAAAVEARQMVRGEKSDQPVQAPLVRTPARAEPRFGGDAPRVEPPVFQSQTPAPAPSPSPASANSATAPVPSRIAPRAPLLRKSKRAKTDSQPALDLDASSKFQLPPLSLLQATGRTTRRADSMNDAALEKNARLLETVLGEFGVHGEIARVNPGPVVTRYELDPAPGTKTSRVIGLADDIARSMSAISARVAVIPGQNLIGIELPNSNREMVLLRELLSTPEYESTSGNLSLALGKNIAGEPVVADLARMPHLLIAGTTGSGKSVAVNTMILSLLYRLTPQQCRLIMIDPKMLELSVYDDIPHLLAPVVTEPGKAVVALKWVVREMQNRYRAMSLLGVRNVAGYNQRVADALSGGGKPTRTVQTGYDPKSGEPVYEEQDLEMKHLPFIVVVVDEMADLMMVAGKDVEAAIQRLSQMARAAGIHLIMATQRPSVDVITGTIKANFPTRVSFQVTSKIDSRTILGEQGAEQLLGQGDMLFMESGGRIQRVHGPFVSDEEVDRVVKALKRQGQPDYLAEVTEEPETDPDTSSAGADDDGDALYRDAVALVLRDQRASTSFVQRQLQIGYNRAARLIERMEAEGVLGPPNRTGKREILMGN